MIFSKERKIHALEQLEKGLIRSMSSNDLTYKSEVILEKIRTRIKIIKSEPENNKPFNIKEIYGGK